MQGAQRQYPHCRKKSMKKMNKVAAAVLAVAMVGSMAVPAFAKDAPAGTDATSAENLTKSAYTKLTYNIPQTYSWTIPNDITFTSDTGTDTGAVGVTNCYINNGATLNIAIAPADSEENATTEDAFVLDSTEGAKYAYEVTKTNAQGTALAKDDVVLTVTGGVANTGTQNLTFTLKGDQQFKTAGNYTGNVKFTASVTQKTK